jgi:DNA-binding transcriptional LysR family regulator
MRHLHVSLEQWRVLQTVVDSGGFAQAAKALHRSQSAISYTISKLQQQLGVTVLEVRGRKAQLTEAGEVLLRRSRLVLEEALALEMVASHLQQGWEPEIRLVVDAAFPMQLLLQALKAFAPQSRGSRVLLKEVVLSGARDALERGDADLVIGADFPQGFLADQLLDIEFIAVAHPDHQLHQLGRTLTERDLQNEMQVVIQDSGEGSPRNVGWLGAEHRWTVSSFDKAITTICSGLGYAWLPLDQIQEQLHSQRLRPLPLKRGKIYHAPLFLCFAQEHPGEASKLLAQYIQETVATRSH